MLVVHSADTRIATLQGAIIILKANTPKELPPSLVPLALAHGARQLETADEPLMGAAKIDITQEATLTPPPVPKETDEVRLQKIMRDIIERGQRDEFRSDGQPKTSTLNRLFGRTVTEVERTAAWEAVMKKV